MQTPASNVPGQYSLGVPPPPLPPPPPGPWSTGLCGCFEDIGSCCITSWCPCITFGRIAEIVDRGTTTCPVSGSIYALINYLSGCAWIYSCTYRTKMRHLLSLQEDTCNDCLVHCCCEPCALCQEYRELKNRGYDLALGWHASVERMQPVGTAAPPVPLGGMQR